MPGCFRKKSYGSRYRKPEWEEPEREEPEREEPEREEPEREEPEREEPEWEEPERIGKGKQIWRKWIEQRRRSKEENRSGANG